MTQTPFMVGPNVQELNKLIASDPIELRAQIRNTLRLLWPQSVKGHKKARFGSAGDGGYVHLDDFQGLDTAVSLGVEHNIDWDRDVADRGLVVHQFDYSVDAPAPGDKRFIFNKTMIAPQAGPGKETLESIISRLDRKQGRPNLILKMDIECAKWAVLEATSLEAISRFSQITCELHYFEAISLLQWRQTFFRGLRKISKFYAPIHVHANNYAPYSMIANVPVANVLEVTFANRSIYDFEDSDEIFPGPLDMPCDPTQPDIFLGKFCY